jgi:hypothetical protein
MVPGDPSIAAALVIAGRVMREQAWQEIAVRVALRGRLQCSPDATDGR